MGFFPWGEVSQEQRSENPSKIVFRHLRISNTFKGQGQLSEKSKGFVECSPLKRGVGLGQRKTREASFKILQERHKSPLFTLNLGQEIPMEFPCLYEKKV